MPSYHFIGMDEAGYGPNLGPLLVAATQWTTPAPAADFDFYDSLAGIVFRDRISTAAGIQIADSKQVYSSSGGLKNLETSALSLLRLAGCTAASFPELVHALDPRHAPEILELPWYLNSCLQLPLDADADDVDRISMLLADRCQEQNLTLNTIQVRLIEPVKFNALLETLPNKAELLTRTAFGLLRELWNPSTESSTLVIGDKHGGRSRYDQLLSEYLDGELIFRLEEQRPVSRYRVGTTELRFQQGGERHLPVAAASIIAKYLRELCMELFNRYWMKQIPELKPTKGYPEDARRYRAEILSTARSLALEECVWWRSR